MPGGYKNIRHEDGNGFENHPENINKQGRPVSIRNQLRDILQSEGTLKIKTEQVKKINDDGSVEIMLPQKDMLAMKLMQWALSKKGTDSLKAIQLIMEHLEGKPAQSLNVKTDQPINQVQLTDEQFDKIMEQIIPKEDDRNDSGQD